MDINQFQADAIARIRKSAGFVDEPVAEVTPEVTPMQPEVKQEETVLGSIIKKVRKYTKRK